jgi:hypothetical protein
VRPQFNLIETKTPACRSNIDHDMVPDMRRNSKWIPASKQSPPRNIASRSGRVNQLGTNCGRKISAVYNIERIGGALMVLMRYL